MNHKYGFLLLKMVLFPYMYNMDYINKTWLIMALFLIVVLLFLLLKILKRHSSLRETSFKEQNMGINKSHAIFVDLSPKSSDIVELAIEIWRVKNRVNKASSDLQEIHRRGLESSVQKMQKFLDRFSIEIVDHTNQKYNEGLSVDVLSFEIDPDIKVPTIKETIEPTIICSGNVVKKGKVVVIKNN